MSDHRKAFLTAALLALAFTAPDAEGLAAQRAEAPDKSLHRWTEHSVTYDPGMGGICLGGSTILLLELPGDRAAQERINAIILQEVNAALNNDSAYTIPASDFRAGKRYQDDSAYYNWDTHATLLADSNGLASFQLETLSNCGGSISDPAEFAYFTVDLIAGSRVGFADVFDTLRLGELGNVVQAYAREQRVDNVEYLGEHDPMKLEYLDRLDTRFNLTPEHLGLFIRVRDANEPDWGRRGREGETIGEEWMRVDMPKDRVMDFVWEA